MANDERDDYVSRFAVRDMLHKQMEQWPNSPDEFGAILDCIDPLFQIPAADVAPVVHGR